MLKSQLIPEGTKCVIKDPVYASGEIEEGVFIGFGSINGTTIALILIESMIAKVDLDFVEFISYNDELINNKIMR